MPLNITEVIRLIESKSSGSRSCMVDLHIHTPASYDYQNKNISPDDIVSRALEKKLNLIAITDHNCVEWCNKVREAAKGKSLIILPGVELV